MNIILDHTQSPWDWRGFQWRGACGRWGLKSVVDACQSNVTGEKTHSILKSLGDAGFKIMHPHSWERVTGVMVGGGGVWNSGDSWV